MKIIFLGTPQIAVPSLEYLINKPDTKIQAVITQPDKPAGRGKCLTCSFVKQAAESAGLSVYCPKSIRKDIELIQKLKELEPDFFITFAFGQILNQEVLDIPKFGTINLHASLLPKYRGANPIQAPIINGDKVTGITTMLTDIGIDTGAIILQKEIGITENMDSCELTKIISEISPELLYQSIKGIYKEEIIPVPQNHAEATHAPKVRKDDGILDWSESSVNIHNKVRGFKPWPSAFAYINGVCIKITETRVLVQAHGSASTDETVILSDRRERKNFNAGKIIGKTKDGINVITGEGIITVTKVQPACKKEMQALSWYNGARLPEGTEFKSYCESEEECTYDCNCDISDK